MPTITLPGPSRKLAAYTTQPPRPLPPGRPPFNRVALASAHVVADPLADGEAAIDWDATIDYRQYLWSLGLGVAEAMDAAQRGAGLDWPGSLELIRRSIGAAPPGAAVVCGASTDHLPPAMQGGGASLQQVIGAYEAQCASIERVGGRVALLPSRALLAVARGPDDYRRVYGRVLEQVQAPVILQWLGPAFDPALAAYWGTEEPDLATSVVLDLVTAHAAKVDGVHLALFEPERELELRRRLPRGVRMYTGDDLHFPALIAGDDDGYSHALLGVFDPIAAAASAALACLQRDDLQAYEAVLAPTLPLARHLLRAPAPFYKTGVTFMAYLNGHQGHFTMIGGLQAGRSLPYLAELFRLADTAGLLRDPDDACARMGRVLAVHGVL